MADKPHEPLPTTLPPLDTSAARKPVKVTRVAETGRSTSHEDVPLPSDVIRSIRYRTVAAYTALGCVAGLAMVFGAPLWVLVAVPLLGWMVGRKLHRRASQALPLNPHVRIVSAGGLELMSRVRTARQAIETMDLNTQIYADLLASIDALPDRIRSIESAENQCRIVLESLAETAESMDEQSGLVQRMARLKESRTEIGNVLDALTLQAAHVTTDSDLDGTLERKLVLQAQALAQTSKDLS